MKLWHFTSTKLQGFYASEVYAIGSTKSEAVFVAADAFDKWIEEHYTKMGFYPLIEDSFDEEGKARIQLLEKRQEFLIEASFNFKEKGKAAFLIRV